ncbi:hypothetical protein BKA93DRAFT_32128 [Sparassis latifolia]
MVRWKWRCTANGIACREDQLATIIEVVKAFRVDDEQLARVRSQIYLSPPRNCVPGTQIGITTLEEMMDEEIIWRRKCFVVSSATDALEARDGREMTAPFVQNLSGTPIRTTPATHMCRPAWSCTTSTYKDPKGSGLMWKDCAGPRWYMMTVFLLPGWLKI